MSSSKGAVAAQLLWHSGAPRLLGRRTWRGVLTLTYHRVLPAPGPRHFAGVWSATPEQFASQLDQITASCDVVGTSAVAELREASGRRVAISFDDGYRDVYDHALPALRARGLPATLFLTTGVLDGSLVPWWDQIAWLLGGIADPARHGFASLDAVIDRYRAARPDRAAALIDELARVSDRAPLTVDQVRDEWITWDMARELAAGGFAIEAHTVSHPLMSRLTPAAQFGEIAGSAERIAEEIGRRPRAFAYPVGQRASFDEHAKVAAKRAGISEAYSLYGGATTNATAWDPFDVRRVGIGLATDAVRLNALLTLPEVFGRATAAARSAGPSARVPATTAEQPAPATRARGRDARTVAPARPAAGRRLRVVTLVDRLADGGAERIAFQLARDMDPERFERVLVVTTADDPAHADPAPETVRWVEQLEAAGVRIVGLPRRRRSTPRGWGGLVDELRRADVVHAHMFSSNLVGSVLGGALRVPVIVGHEHGLHRDAAWHGPLERRLVARRRVTMIAPSQAVRDRMVRTDKLRSQGVLVVPNGVEPFAPSRDRDLRRDLGIAPDAFVIGSVGGLREIKRFDVLIEAAATVRHELGVPLTVLIAGGGPERARLERRIAARGLERDVHLLGPRDDVPDVLAALDVAINCSDSEACPLSVLEYMAAGLPTLATDVGGTPELLEDGEHGILVPPATPSALAQAIVALHDDPERRRRMGAAAQARRRAAFDLDLMVRRVEGLYEQRIAAHAGS
jgi:glycosyltransferase involved in cell wall biosynthesis/peptidoglycan/xylan/chitin deacetylase (PgdA/CDA1 family)